MKYLKTYEENINKYQEGDYVHLKSGNTRFISMFHCALIIKTNIIVLPGQYCVTTFRIDNNEGELFWVHDDEIEPATPEEIEELKAIENSKKYNI